MHLTQIEYDNTSAENPGLIKVSPSHPAPPRSIDLHIRKRVRENSGDDLGLMNHDTNDISPEGIIASANRPPAKKPNLGGAEIVLSCEAPSSAVVDDDTTAVQNLAASIPSSSRTIFRGESSSDSDEEDGSLTPAIASPRPEENAKVPPLNEASRSFYPSDVMQQAEVCRAISFGAESAERDITAYKGKEKATSDGASLRRFCNYHIPFERLHFDPAGAQPLAEGSFGVVRRATLLPDTENEAEGPGISVAVKALKTGRTTFERLERIFTRELMVLSTIKHPNIAEFIGYYVSIERLTAWLITAWAPGGDIFTHLRSGDRQVGHKLNLILNVTEGLKYLHSLNITHGDVKAQNVLLYDEETAQLCDFGLAQLQDNPDFPAYEESSKFAGSTRWCSPEFLTEGIRRPPQDVWAWGWLMWEIMTGLLPYHNIPNEARVVFSIVAPNANALPDFKKHSELDGIPTLCKLLVRCWNRQASERPSIEACLNVVKELC